ncbi:hypothetical protein RHMOL_Rhmol12G0139300 [Rhododendron molle]|uniref:Uncharacterized protein n=1 Tax=Rhododendron molle TaxID=49168 RepID=A0ACC0LJE7_RHOML|nr:hypothetical protein RHMOL_Rhmol12G0139300 [Rhododendron molle]
MKFGSSSNQVFGSDFWKEEMNTVVDPCPAKGGFVKGRSDPVVGKSGCFWTVLPSQIRVRCPSSSPHIDL